MASSRGDVGLNGVDGCCPTGDVIKKFHVAETNTVGITSGREVESDDVIARAGSVVQRLERDGLKGRSIAILIVGEAVKQMVILADLVIQFRDSLGFTEWR